MNAAEIGIRGDEFWGMSSYELELQFKGALQRMDGLYDLGMFVAWHMAAFSRADRLPSLKSVMEKMRGRSEAESPTGDGRPTWQEMKARMKSISAAAAVAPPVKPKRKKGKG